MNNHDDLPRFRKVTNFFVNLLFIGLSGPIFPVRGDDPPVKTLTDNATEIIIRPCVLRTLKIPFVITA